MAAKVKQVMKAQTCDRCGEVNESVRTVKLCSPTGKSKLTKRCSKCI